MILGNTKKINVVIPPASTVAKKSQQNHLAEIPEAWEVYTRLVNPNYRACRVRDDYINKGCLVDLSTVKLPSKDGLKCKCFENVMYAVREISCYTPPLMCGIMRKRQANKWMKETKRLLTENEKCQLPLATLTVRWQLKRNLPDYDLHTLYSLFTKYGEVRDLRMLSPNSALVVFDELTSACFVANSRYLGEPLNRIHCRFWHRTMENKALVPTQKGSKVKRIPFL